MVTLKGLGTHKSRAETRDLRRVLLIASSPGSGSVVSASAAPSPDLSAVAKSLRAAGFEAEIYDAARASISAESVRLHIEHSYPHVVAAVADGATNGAARDVLRAAKEVIPGVLTVLISAQSALVSGKARKDASVDYVVDDGCAESLPGLLARLSGGEQSGRIAAVRAA